VGKIPVLHDSVTGRIVPETSIIIEYLQAHYPGPVRLLPCDAEQQLQVRLWDRFFDLYVSVPMQKIVTDKIRPANAGDPLGVGEARSTLDQAYSMIEDQIRDKHWTTGDDFTMADCSALPALFFAIHRPSVFPRPATCGRISGASDAASVSQPRDRRSSALLCPVPLPGRDAEALPSNVAVTALPAAGFDRVFHALSDPYRRGFVEQLAKGPASVKELAASADVGLPAVLKHLRVLEEGGIVVSQKVGRVRTYRMRQDAFHAINGWIEQRHAEMNAAFDRLSSLMAEVPEEKDH
jgi:glutathione S-transferase/DNA-binding transcriptional ArsR family regulator